MNRQYRKMIDDPTMSDKTLLVSVEDLIHTAFGSKNKNRVNLKLLQTILHILARQLHILEQDVEIKFDEIETAFEQIYDNGYDDESGTYPNSFAKGGKGEGGSERGRKRDDRREKKDLAKKEKKGNTEKQGEKKERGEKGEKDEKGEKMERNDGRGIGEKEYSKTSSKDREDKVRSKEKDEKDKISRVRDESSGSRRGEDDGDGGSREREQGRERKGDKDGSSGAKRDKDNEDEDSREVSPGRSEERGADASGGRGGEREAYGSGGREDEEREDRDAQGEARGGFGRDFGRQTSGTSITVSAVRGPAARVRPAHEDSIEVVTASQFALLRKAVEQLEQITGPLPAPVLPDNETLRQDLATGRASLQDTMQAVQLNARVQVAEQGMYRMAELLTQLAQSGMLPPKFAGQVGAMEEYLQTAMAAGYAAAGPGGPGGPDRRSGPGGPGGPGGPDGREWGPVEPARGRGRPSAGPRGTHFDGGIELGASPGSIRGTASTMSRTDAKKSTAAIAAGAEAQGRTWVMHNEMHEVLQNMKDALFKEINNWIALANHSADMASNLSRCVAEKLDIVMQIDARIDTLFQETADYAEQLSMFDSGIMTQMQSFQEQLLMMRNDLSGGLALLQASNNNAETADLLDLTERHEGLVVELDNTFHRHQNLHVVQHQIGDELKSLIHCVEMLREQKCDRDEVVDGLRDKADISRLAGLLYEKDFVRARFEIEKRISKCYEVFNRQDMKWRDAQKDLTAIVNNKAENYMLKALKGATKAEVNAIQKLLRKLEIMLGEPKAALLMRKLAKHASCLTRALMEPQGATYGKPLPLPALRPPPIGAERQPCFGEIKLAPSDIRNHTCHRWVGGSHTLMGNIVKEQGELMPLQIMSIKKFEEYGSDGKLYMMEEDMQPCAECNKLSTDESPYLPAPNGAGDQALAPLA